MSRVRPPALVARMGMLGYSRRARMARVSEREWRRRTRSPADSSRLCVHNPGSMSRVYLDRAEAHLTSPRPEYAPHMSALALVALWQARPFHPFRVRLCDGRSFDILGPSQLAASSDLQTFALALPQGALTFAPGSVAHCEALADHGTHHALAGSPLFSAGTLRLMTISTTDGLTLTNFVMKNGEDGLMLSSAGTRWSVMGVESFENGRSIHLVHADDPLLQVRVIAWPPDRATLASFAESEVCAVIQQRLIEMDGATIAKPGNAVAAKGYLDSITHEEGAGGARPSEALDLSDGYFLELWPADPSMRAPFLHPRITGPHDRCLLDLRGSAWGVVHPCANFDGSLSMSLVNRDDAGGAEFPRIHMTVDLRARRFIRPGTPGITALGVLHVQAHACRTFSMLESRLREALERGVALT